MSNIKNINIAKILFEIADLLELKGIEFKPRAYRRAAQSVESLSSSILKYYKEGKLENIQGIGDSIASKIEEILENGNLKYLNELRKEFPEDLRELMKIQGLGPKRLMKLYENLKIKDLEDLEEAAEKNEIREIEGFGEKSEENIIKGIKMFKQTKERFLLGDILPIAQEMKKKLNQNNEVEKIKICGSIRRMKETIGDLDILIISDKPESLMDFFVDLEEVKRVLSKGKTRSTIITKNNLQVDLRIVERKNFGSALQYFTGSKEHNVKLRKIASDKDWKLSEYGLRDKSKNEIIAGENEHQIYNKLGLAYIQPELRTANGEIEAAKNNELPELIDLGEIKGDLHIHTNWSEGKHSIKEMAKRAIELNYEYIAICDHSKGLPIANGLDEDKFRTQIEEIDQLNEEIKKIEIIKGAEVNIDKNGKIDLNNSLLKDLDLVIASIHSGFKKSKSENTERLINAMHNDYVDIIGHPTGRILQKRESMDLDLDQVFRIAEELGVVMELNAFPTRLDLSDINCRKAKDYGITIAINTDSHDKNHMFDMRLGIGTARRGWIERSEVLNTLNLKNLQEVILK